MERDFDIIVFGASGATGELVVEEMAKNAIKENIRWAVAGRNLQKVQKKLVKVQSRLNTDSDLESIRIFQADIENKESLELMCQNTKLLINCVGPYAKYGKSVLEACLKCGTHTIDMSVEIQYIHCIMLKYYQEAESREVYIVSSCGIGSIYPETAVQFLQEKYEGRIDKIDVFFKPEPKFGSVQFSTWDSVVNMSSGLRNLLITRQNVYSEIMNKTKSKWRIFGLSYLVKFSTKARGLGFIIPSVLHTVPLGMDMKEELFEEKPYPGFFSCGLVKTSDQEDEKDAFNLNIVAVATGRREGPRRCWNVGGNRNQNIVLYGSCPTAYRTSAICVLHAALTVLQETDSLPKRGGVYTPLAAFAKTSLLSRLQNNGIMYKEKENKFSARPYLDV